jgi:hypothetical protein
MDTTPNAARHAASRHHRVGFDETQTSRYTSIVGIGRLWNCWDDVDLQSLVALFVGDGPAGIVVVVEPAGSMRKFECSTKQPCKPPEQLLTNDGDGISSFVVCRYDYYCGDEASLSRSWHHNMSIIVA